VLELLVKGKSNKEIGNDSRSRSHRQGHITNILGKLGVSDRTRP